MTLLEAEFFKWELIPLEDPNLHLGMTGICNSIPAKLLTEKEYTEFSRITNPSRGAEFITSRILLREIALKHGYPDDFHIQKDTEGRPFGVFKEGKCPLSISHTQSCISGIISEQKEVGLDIEEASRTVNPLLEKRILHPDEKKLAGELSLIRIWTIKESILKLLGTGLRKNMSDLKLETEEHNTFHTTVDSRKIKIQSFSYKKWWIAISLFE